jgi:hypothetical protein
MLLRDVLINIFHPRYNLFGIEVQVFTGNVTLQLDQKALVYFKSFIILIAYISVDPYQL